MLGVGARATLVVTLWLQWRFFRRAWRNVLQRRSTEYRPRAWLRFYVTVMCAAALISFAVSPTTIMFWQVFVALPASALAMVMSAEVLFRSHHRLAAQRVAGLWAVVSAALLLSQAVASPMYRCGGSSPGEAEPMLADLHAKFQCVSTARLQPKPLQPPTRTVLASNRASETQVRLDPRHGGRTL